ncbi:NAD-dependent epimerase/dehydratase family protein [Alkanindiges sp. WGS2144]|uniref:NAD-dependent epimerase/dehydratase family protein n=1 Tax=Alkanindiges sp. WGS2144 TaxID=3366808 RepID=UPI003752C4B2
MNIFITGATGYIGGSVAQALVDAGHQVRGLVRHQEKAERLKQRGIQPVFGNLDDTKLLTQQAQQADAVINAADSDHRGAVEALLNGLYGSDKIFIHTSGSSVIGDDAQGNITTQAIFDENTPFVMEPEKQHRHAIDQLVLQGAKRGVQSMVLCNSMIYGTGLGIHADSVQIPPLVRYAQQHHEVRIVGQGINRWSNVHIQDVVDLYLLVIQQPKAGTLFFVENGEASFAEIAQSIARRLNLGEVQSWTVEEATAHWGFAHAHYSFGSNSRVRGNNARNLLNWHPKHNSVQQWIEQDMPL